jgi:hypothetical protein
VAALQRKPSLDLGYSFWLEKTTCIDNPEQAKTVPCRPIENAPAIFSHAGVLVFDMLCMSDGVGHVADQPGERREPLPSRISTSIIQAVIQ